MQLTCPNLIAIANAIVTLLKRYLEFPVRNKNHIRLSCFWLVGEILELKLVDAKALPILSRAVSNDLNRGFIPQQFREMRQFYRLFPKNSIHSELSWSHYILLITIESNEERNFYHIEAYQNQWTVRQLKRQIQSRYFYRQGDGLLKEPFLLEFLDLGNLPPLQERELETALLEQLQFFLLELGKGFAFVARQQAVTTETGKRFYIDLVFYHFILKCFVLIDLKVGELSHQHIGQMDLYIRLYEEKWRTKNDQPTLGIILCTEKDHTIVKYSMLDGHQQLFAAKYQYYLPKEEELENWFIDK